MNKFNTGLDAGLSVWLSAKVSDFLNRTGFIIWANFGKHKPCVYI